MKKVKGFTLLELMVVLALAGVLATLAAPSFQSLLSESRITSIANEFAASLYSARSMSISKGKRITLCTSRDGESCEKNIHWSSGWLMFEDDANFGEIDQGEPIVWTHEKLPDSYQLKGNRSVKDYISYTPQGAARSRSGGFQAGAVTLSLGQTNDGTNDQARRKIVLSSGGRVRIIRME